MRRIFAPILGLLAIVCLLAMMACDGSNGPNGVLAAKDPTSPFAAIPILEGLHMGAQPGRVLLDPCAPNAPRDPVTGKLTATVAIGAVLRDDALQPMPNVGVTFTTTGGTLLSAGSPMLTDGNGLAEDTLTVDEDDAPFVDVTAATATLSTSIRIAVEVVPAPPIQLRLNPVELWPPDHQLHEVVASFPGMECSPEATFALESVTSNEADDGTGDGDTPGDIQGAEMGTADATLLLRAERSGGGQGRIYTIVYRVTDQAGEMTRRTGTVTVPHDQGH
jgi:hypothetical protein